MLPSSKIAPNMLFPECNALDRMVLALRRSWLQNMAWIKYGIM